MTTIDTVNRELATYHRLFTQELPNYRNLFSEMREERDAKSVAAMHDVGPSYLTMTIVFGVCAQLGGVLGFLSTVAS